MRQPSTDFQTTARPAPIRAETAAKLMQQRSVHLVAWGPCLVFSFLQYALRSAHGVMIPELIAAFGLTTPGLSAPMLISGLGIASFSAFMPPYFGGLLFGVGSGAAMTPYAMIKDANPDNVKGGATGAMNFHVFSLGAFLAPAFGLALTRLSGGQPLNLENFQEADLIRLGAIVLSLNLTFFQRETRAARRAPAAGSQAGEQERK